MKTVGFLISEKENEKRRAIDLKDIKKVKNRKNLFFQQGYGEKLGFSDEDIIKAGCNVKSKEEILKCDIICEPKIGDSELLKEIKNKIIFGWIHATQNHDITQICVDNKLTVYAWEKMFDEDGRHIFNINNQIAGQAAIFHAMLEYGKTFYNLEAAVIGNGNTAKGAIAALEMLGAKVKIYKRNMEKEFVNNMHKYDIIVNCILWDVTRNDHIIYKKDLKQLKKNSIIIDVSCDKNGGIETSIPTTIQNPTYMEDGIMHYVVDHTPTLLYKDATESISEEVVRFLDNLIQEKDDNILKNALIIKEGKILDQEINKFQNRKE